MMAFNKKILSLALLILIPTSSFAQGFFGGNSVGLTCENVSDIEGLYLEGHVKYTARDEGLRQRTVEQYLKRDDGIKLYFLKSDVDEIQKWTADLFTQTKKKNCEVFSRIQERLLMRVKERESFAKKLLSDKKFAFDPKVEFVFDPDKSPRFETKEQAEEFLKKYIQFQISNYLATDLKLKEAKERVLKNWSLTVKRVQDRKPKDLVSNYLDSYARALDPHSTYFSMDDFEDFKIGMNTKLRGIGATLTSQEGFTVIESLITGGPAARSGLLQPQDKIVAVGQGTKGAMENVIDMDLKDVVKKIRGEKGTKVRLSILRKSGDGKERLEYTLVRDEIQLVDEQASISYVDREVGGEKKKIAIINLPSFYSGDGRSCAADVKKLVAEARQQKAQGLILDLSSNGGGSLEDAVKMTGLFFDQGNVVKRSSRPSMPNAEEMLADDDSAVDWQGPLVVLTSRVSASASEIVAGALQDYQRAVIVGNDHTFGKGTVQQVVNMPGKAGAMKVTIGMFFTPGGSSTQHRGVESDIKIPGIFENDEIGEKNLDYSLPAVRTAPFLSKEALPKQAGNKWTPITTDLVKKLSDKSSERVSQNSEFKKIIEDLEKAKVRGKLIKLAEVVKDQGEKKKKQDQDRKIRSASKEEKLKEYLKKPELQESVNVMTDLLSLVGTKSLTQKN